MNNPEAYQTDASQVLTRQVSLWYRSAHENGTESVLIGFNLSEVANMKFEHRIEVLDDFLLDGDLVKRLSADGRYAPMTIK